jgi:hypothetical protein
MDYLLNPGLGLCKPSILNSTNSCITDLLSVYFVDGAGAGEGDAAAKMEPKAPQMGATVTQSATNDDTGIHRGATGGATGGPPGGHRGPPGGTGGHRGATRDPWGGHRGGQHTKRTCIVGIYSRLVCIVGKTQEAQVYSFGHTQEAGMYS